MPSRRHAPIDAPHCPPYPLGAGRVTSAAGARHGRAGPGRARLGVARRGRARRGEVTPSYADQTSEHLPRTQQHTPRPLPTLHHTTAIPLPPRLHPPLPRSTRRPPRRPPTMLGVRTTRSRHRRPRPTPTHSPPPQHLARPAPPSPQRMQQRTTTLTMRPRASASDTGGGTPPNAKHPPHRIPPARVVRALTGCGSGGAYLWGVLSMAGLWKRSDPGGEVCDG